MELSLSTFSIRDLIGEVTESLQAIAIERQITLNASHLKKLPAIHGDRDKLGQVLTNLIHNGIKFTAPGGKVTIETNLPDDHVLQVRVMDTGCGIDETELEKVFDRFYRSPSTSPETGGVGLGLAITKSLVELHGGKIWVESVVGKGTEFVVLIPTDLPASRLKSI